jgi:FMN-dependent NADH-azoreductase
VLLGGNDLYGEFKEAWEDILSEIRRFLSADAYLISTPMWNFSVPYTLKHYIDIIVQPNYLFRYAEGGVEDLAKNKKMAVITSRGGEYSSEKTRSLDFQEPYLRTIFGFVGITDITFIHAQAMDIGMELQTQKLGEAQTRAREIAGHF